MVLVIVATALRVIGLDGGLWIDEIYSLVRSFREPMWSILTTYWGDNHHPLYAVLAHLARGAFGESAWSIRLPALVFGVAAVPMVYFLGRTMMPKREALLASALLAVSYHHVWFSQNARGYSAIAFFSLLGIWALIRGIETRETRFFIAYAVAAALGAYTHLTMVLVVVGHAAAVALWLAMGKGADERGATLRGAAIAFLLGGTLTLLLYAPMMRDVFDYFLNRPSQLRGISTPTWAFFETVRVLVLGMSGGTAVLGAIVMAGGAVVGLSGFVSLWQRCPLFGAMLIGAAVATVVGAGMARGTMYPRFFFFAIGPAMLVVVRGAFAAANWAAERVRRPALGDPFATAGVAAVTVLSALSLGFNYRYPKQDFEGAMRYVVASRAPDDRVITTGLPADPYRMLYQQSWPNVTTGPELDRARSPNSRTWVVWTFPRYLEKDVGVILQRECPQPRAFRGTVGGGDVLVCSLEPRP